MAIEKITSADLAGKGVIGLPDIPALTTSEMQNKFEETARDVIIPKVNEMVDGMYTKQETDAQINAKIISIGAGDMAKGVYDTDNNGQVDSRDNADRLGGQLPSYYATATQVQSAQQVADSAIQKGDVRQIFVVDSLPAQGVDGGLYLLKRV